MNYNCYLYVVFGDAKSDDLDAFRGQRIVKYDSLGILQADETFEWQFIGFRVFVIH